MSTLNIYFNHVHRQEELERLVSMDIPLVFSVIPRAFVDGEIVRKYPDWVQGILREAANKPGILISQRGFQHKCAAQHINEDPWHENHCLHLEGSIPRSFQHALMERGKHIIYEKLGVIPGCYSPPNHLFDRHTLDLAASMGYQFLMDLAAVRMKLYHQYRHDGIIIVPETSLERNTSSHLYVHYDHIEGQNDKFNPEERKLYEALIRMDLASLRDCKPCNIYSLLAPLNRMAKHHAKRRRDEYMAKN